MSLNGFSRIRFWAFVQHDYISFVNTQKNVKNLDMHELRLRNPVKHLVTLQTEGFLLREYRGYGLYFFPQELTCIH